MSGYVLIVEDNEKLARMYEKVLKHAGFETLSTPSAQEAITAFEEFRPDIVFLDWRLVDGTSAPFLQYVQELKLDYPPRIMVISAEVTKRDLANYLDVIEDYFEKPVSPKDMVTMIRS